MGKKIKEIQPSYNIHIGEIILGLLAIISYFIKPIKENFLDNYVYFGIPLSLIFLVLGAILVIYAGFKFLKRSPDSTIEIYEDGIVVGDFKSSFDDLIIRTKGNGFIFSNASKEIDYKERLNKADYNYIKNLG